MQVDSKIDTSGAAIITLAKREWFVPVLAMRQNRVAVPRLIRLMPMLEKMQKKPDVLSEENVDAIIDVVHAALTRAYPALTREEFLDLPISTQELIWALAPILRQTGAFTKGDDAPGEQKGETTLGSPAPLPTSTG